MRVVFFSKLNLGSYYLFLGILLLARVYCLSFSAPFDYDSVYNYQILEQIAKKNYQNIFHHASPAFYAVFSLLFEISSNFWFLVYCNALIGTLAIHIFATTFYKHNGLFVLFLGFSLLLVANSRYLSIEGISLLGSALLWSKIKYFFDASKNYSEKNEKLTSNFPLHSFSFSIAFLLLLLLLSNYKILVPLFFIFSGILFSSWHNSNIKDLYIKAILFSALYFIFGLLLIMLGGVVLGHKWYQYPATIVAIIATAQNTSASSWDFSYYFRYITSFENPLLLFFIFIALINFVKNHSEVENFQKIIWYVFLGTFITMTLLAKAPRGLIFCLPLGYYLAFDWAYDLFKNLQVRKRFFIASFAFVAFCLQTRNILLEIYAPLPTNYTQVAQYLSANKADVVFSTLGLSVYPYLDKNIKLVLMREAKDSVLFHNYSGNKFLLYDAYTEAANHQSLISLKSTNFDTTFSEKSLCSKMLYLETSQYNGLTFSQSIKAAEIAQKEAFQIGIKKLGK